LTQEDLCATLLKEGQRQVLAREAGLGADSSRPESLDDVAFLELVERLAPLSLLDFLAVFQAARYRRRFGKRIDSQSRGRAKKLKRRVGTQRAVKEEAKMSTLRESNADEAWRLAEQTVHLEDGLAAEKDPVATYAVFLSLMCLSHCGHDDVSREVPDLPSEEGGGE
jgi:hypothetical protein